MFHWEPEGHYCSTKYMAIVPFWFSTKHLWTAIMPFWLSTDENDLHGNEKQGMHYMQKAWMEALAISTTVLDLEPRSGHICFFTYVCLSQYQWIANCLESKWILSLLIHSRNTLFTSWYRQECQLLGKAFIQTLVIQVIPYFSLLCVWSR